jgi:hypothetical protein
MLVAVFLLVGLVLVVRFIIESRTPDPEPRPRKRQFRSAPQPVVTFSPYELTEINRAVSALRRVRAIDPQPWGPPKGRRLSELSLRR